MHKSALLSLSGLTVLSLDVTNGGNARQIQLDWRITEVQLAKYLVSIFTNKKQA